MRVSIARVQLVGFSPKGGDDYDDDDQYATDSQNRLQQLLSLYADIPFASMSEIVFGNKN